MRRVSNLIYVQLMNDEKVKGVVSMNENFELAHWVSTRDEYQKLGIDFLQLNTPDIFHAPTQEKLRQGVAFIKRFEGTGHSVYVHCKAGRTRSATLVGCYLIQVSHAELKSVVFKSFTILYFRNIIGSLKLQLSL